MLTADYEKKFSYWMYKNTKLSKYSQGRYIGAINKISYKVLEINPEYTSIEELIKSTQAENLINLFFALPEIRSFNDKGNRMYSSAFKKILQFQNDQIK